MRRISDLSNKAAKAGSIISVASLLVAPVSSFALSTHAATAAAASKSQTSPFCTNLAAHANAISTSLTDRSGKVTSAWSQQDQKLTTEWQQVDQKVAAGRQKADTDRNADFTKLEAKAKTGAEKQAIQTYEAAVHGAVTTRRAAYDDARQAFRTGVQAAISGRHATVTSQLDIFQSSVNSAISTAEASCASDPGSGPAIRQTLQASLKSARTTFQSDRKGDNTIGSQVKQLAATRDAAFKTADKVFQTSLSNARQTLQQAFGKTNNSV
jgi:hypothetical protein